MVNLALFRSVFLFAITNVLAAGLPLLLLPLLTRMLTPEDYGLVAMYSVVLTALGALTGLLCRFLSCHSPRNHDSRSAGRRRRPVFF
jgi:Polysaccharide biosynthesis protein